ncbi:MAG: hypothetical protein ACE5EA_06525 [Nitrospirota bacterium]
MKVYEIIIKPQSGFGTPIKGDTLFGHFCWQIAYDETLLGKSLDELLNNYDSDPFIVFSSAYPKFDGNIYAFKRPDLPLNSLFEPEPNKKEAMKNRKKQKAKRWMLWKEGKQINSFKELDFTDDSGLLNLAHKIALEELQKQMKRTKPKGFTVQHTQFHNKINRLTSTTGEEGFAPFSVKQEVYFPQTELVIFAGIDESIDIEQVIKGLERIGDSGFGKDASTGLGRFDLGDWDKINLDDFFAGDPDACYTLSPSVPEKNIYKRQFFSPFIRFGRHGDLLAKSGNPFKTPVIMADEGAVFVPKDQEIFERPFLAEPYPVFQRQARIQ